MTAEDCHLFFISIYQIKIFSNWFCLTFQADNIFEEVLVKKGTAQSSLVGSHKILILALLLYVKIYLTNQFLVLWNILKSVKIGKLTYYHVKILLSFIWPFIMNCEAFIQHWKNISENTTLRKVKSSEI